MKKKGNSSATWGESPYKPLDLQGDFLPRNKKINLNFGLDRHLAVQVPHHIFEAKTRFLPQKTRLKFKIVKYLNFSQLEFYWMVTVSLALT